MENEILAAMVLAFLYFNQRPGATNSCLVGIPSAWLVIRPISASCPVPIGGDGSWLAGEGNTGGWLAMEDCLWECTNHDGELLC